MLVAEGDAMAEREWDALINSLSALTSRPTAERKLRLFAVACCDRVRHLFVVEVSWQAVCVADWFAGTQATEETLVQANDAAQRANRSYLHSTTHAGFACSR